MSTLEHYFENLLYHGEDVYGGINKRSLTPDVQNTVEVCAQYVIYSIFGNRKAFEKFIDERSDGDRYFNDIDAQPTDDVVERKTGKWIKMLSDVDGIYWTCSECGETIPRVPHFDPQFDLFPRLESIEKTNFCPNCGADMREETEK